jgi:hypothetical protein
MRILVKIRNDKKELNKLQKEIIDIRQKLWEDYAKHLS